MKTDTKDNGKTPVEQIREALPAELPKVLCRVFPRPAGWKGNLHRRVLTAIRYLGIPEVKWIAIVMLEAAEALHDPPPNAARLHHVLWEHIYH